MQKLNFETHNSNMFEKINFETYDSNIFAKINFETYDSNIFAKIKFWNLWLQHLCLLIRGQFRLNSWKEKILKSYVTATLWVL